MFNQYFKTVSPSQQTYSCSCDGTILQWDSASLKVKRQFYLSCERLSSIQIHDGTLWCCECFSLYTHNSCSANLFHTHTQIINDSSIYCSSLKSYCCSLYFIACVCARVHVCAGCGDSIVELKKSGTPQRRMSLPDDLRSTPSSFSSFIVIPEVILNTQPKLWLLIKQANCQKYIKHFIEKGFLYLQCLQTL